MMHLRRIPGLKDLRLDGTKVSNASMDSLKGMVALKDLDLSDTLFSWAGTAELHHLLPGTVIHNSPLYYSPGLLNRNVYADLNLQLLGRPSSVRPDL